jgi:hypothetical protein
VCACTSGPAGAVVKAHGGMGLSDKDGLVIRAAPSQVRPCHSWELLNIVPLVSLLTGALGHLTPGEGVPTLNNIKRRK